MFHLPQGRSAQWLCRQGPEGSGFWLSCMCTRCGSYRVRAPTDQSEAKSTTRSANQWEKSAHFTTCGADCVLNSWTESLWLLLLTSCSILTQLLVVLLGWPGAQLVNVTSRLSGRVTEAEPHVPVRWSRCRSRVGWDIRKISQFSSVDLLAHFHPPVCFTCKSSERLIELKSAATWYH